MTGRAQERAVPAWQKCVENALDGTPARHLILPRRGPAGPLMGQSFAKQRKIDLQLKFWPTPNWEPCVEMPE
jgi:hypothetical protein